ncbi:hypothetical protein TNCV_1993881 [Trichonephila clavipes]|nr:hypothetical protein TNCV_1993881 [Trichonephila clavipes]
MWEVRRPPDYQLDPGRVRNEPKSVASRKTSKPYIELLDRLVVAILGEQLQTDMSPCRLKEAIQVNKCHSSLTVHSNRVTSVAVYCDQTPSQKKPVRRRSESYIPGKVDHRWNLLELCKEHKNWTSHQCPL